MKICRITLILLVVWLGHGEFVSLANDPPAQPPEQVYNEMLAVYYMNLARRDNGLPPVRWNAQMTRAARWFSWDSVDNRPGGYCGHQDTLGRWPSERVPAFGYLGASGAENCFCGYVTPQAAIDGWINSPGHRNNLLDLYTREVGMGYYRRADDGRGYVTLDLGHDAVFAPVIIDREAIQTTEPTVELYIYDRQPSGGFAGLGPATEMQIANEPCFVGATWEPYQAQKSWSLEPGRGWRTVYAKTRDAVGRTMVVSDTIYLGPAAPLDKLGVQLASWNADRVTAYGLDTRWPQVQFSSNWFVDDLHETFHLWWGNGERVNDAAARGGTAFRLRTGDGESFAWVLTTEFVKNNPLVAYARLKVSDNTGVGEVARFSIQGGGVEYGPLQIKGTDFNRANEYQEFPLAFTFHENPDEVFLILGFARSGVADVWVDGVTLFTAPQAVLPSLTWRPPGGNCRGGGVWVRYLDGRGGFSAIEEAQLTASRLAVSPETVTLIAEAGTLRPAAGALAVARSGCVPFGWTVHSSRTWLQARADGDRVVLDVDARALAVGAYQATLTVEAEEGVLGSPIEVPVRTVVAPKIHHGYLPLVMCGG